MKVKELIAHLKRYPEDAEVEYENGDYKDSTLSVTRVDYQKEPGWGTNGNTIILS